MTELPRTLKIATVWLLIGLALFAGIKVWQGRAGAMRFHAEGGTVELRRAPDGHYHWPGALNGVPVDFLVDTGATSTALPLALAEQAGLQALYAVQSSTAGGTASGHVARAELRLDGGVHVRGLQVTVLPELKSPLLGMDVLSRMRFTQADGVLRFETPNAGDPR